MTGKVVVAKNATTTQYSVTENFSATHRKIRAVLCEEFGATIRKFLIVRFAGGAV